MLVTGEVALSFVLLIGAGLLIRSFMQLTNVNRGFRTEGRLWFSVSLPGSYWAKETGKEFLDRFLERLSADPAVIAAGSVSNRPVEGGDPGMAIDSHWRAKTAGPAPWAGWRIITPGYFRAVGIPLLKGRRFDQKDVPVWGRPGQPEPARHVIVSNRLARLLFGDKDPVGEHATLWQGQGNLDAEIVGVVGDSHERGLAAEPALTVYLPFGARALTTEFVVHTRMNPLSFVPTVRSIVASLDPALPVTDVRSFEQVIDRSVAPERLNAVFVTTFGGMALVLATIGIYGVLSYTTSRRTAEIGLRVALGASRADILLMTVRQGLRPALLGIIVGVIGAWWLSRFMSALLFGVRPFDPVTFAAVTALLLLTALAACYVPGLRALRIDPAVALRIE
jgi:putative ABC transport system permease protein